MAPAQRRLPLTREEKLPLDRSDVKAQHRAVAEAHGDQPSRVVREARERGPAQTHDPARHAHAAVTYARDKCFEREAVVDQRELMKEALKHASGKAPSEHVSRAFEERVTPWKADSHDEAIRRAEREVRTYVSDVSDEGEYTGLAQSFELFDEPGDGSEVFSLMRDSDLDPESYLDQFFDTGDERQRGIEDSSG